MTKPLRRADYLILTAYCLVLFGFAVWFNRTLTSHETVGCVNIREMRADGDFVIPHYGGRPWLERPPLPFWLTIPFVEALGDSAPAYRLAPLCVAVGCVMLVAWMASVWYGRGVGLLSGLILATIREFTHYATGPECDMFLCGIVTSAMALFVYLEFRRRPAEDEGGFFVGKRPPALLVFFILLGLANLAKGLFFGDLFLLLPIAAFLLLGGDRWALVKRYVWLPGWLAFAAAASAWAASAYLRYPDIVELWKHDYAGRYNQGYMIEPWWYYLGHLPLNLFPWTLVAFLGLAVTSKQAFGGHRTPERFLWCWALVPIVFFSIPQGKHHHYLLQATAPWAVLSAVGLVRLWHWLPTLNWLDRPWPLLVTVALPGEVVLAIAGAPLGRLLPAALALWPLIVLVYWWIFSRPSLLVASMAMFALLLPLHWLGHAALPLLNDRFAPDLAFMDQVRETVPPEAPLLVYDDFGPLGSSWFLYYLDGRAQLLHHPSFLLRDDVPDEVFVITRRYSAPRFLGYAQSAKLAESERTQDEGRDDQRRFGLYRLRLHPGLARYHGPVYISPMQATGRALGPDLAGS